jgi:hypothetical protein
MRHSLLFPRGKISSAVANEQFLKEFSAYVTKWMSVWPEQCPASAGSTFAGLSSYLNECSALVR